LLVHMLVYYLLKLQKHSKHAAYESKFCSPRPTNIEAPTVLSWGFFLSGRASSRVFAGIRAEACGLRRLAQWSVHCRFPLSPGHSSLRPRSPRNGRSPQRAPNTTLRINRLRADESSGCFSALPTRRGRHSWLAVQAPRRRSPTTR
jgi:hypothetical protein